MGKSSDPGRTSYVMVFYYIFVLTFNLLHPDLFSFFFFLGSIRAK